MRIVLIHRYFWPDTAPYGILLRRIAEHLASDGNEVTVFTGQPTYSAKVSGEEVQHIQQLDDNLTIHRARMFSEKRLRIIFRILNDLMFCIMVFLHILFNRPKLVMCSTQPPVIGAAAASLASRIVGAKFFYHLQDVHPEVVCETGHVKNSILFRILKWIDCRTVHKADRIIVLSADMKQAIVDRDVSATDRVAIIPNFNLPRFDDLESPPEEMAKPPGRFRLMFAGNVGRFQNLDKIVEACLNLSVKEDFEFVLLGDGKAKRELQSEVERAGSDQVKFIPRQPLSIAEPLMQDSDLCVVSLEEKVYRYAFPSKLASYLSLGAAVLIVCEDESQLSQLAVNNGFGLACAQSSSERIAEKIRFAVENPAEIAKMRANATKFFDENYSLARVLPQWSQLLAEAQHK